MQALYSQSSFTPKPIYSTPDLTHLQAAARGCGWFVAITKSTSPNDSVYYWEDLDSPTYVTKAIVNGEIRCLELEDPFDCGVEWVKVEALRYRLLCPIATRRFDVQVWADPALIGATILMCLAVEDEVTGERFLHVSNE
jgi:hypothetical protein